MWGRLQELAENYFDEAKAIIAANNQLATTGKKSSGFYVPPSMIGGRFPVISGPQEQEARNEANALMNRGMQAEGKGDFRAARDCYAQSAKLLPRDHEIAFAHANIFLRLGEAEVSISLFRDLCITAPRSAKYQSAYGSALAKAGQNEEALKAFEEALQLEPGRPATVVNKVLVLQRLGRNADATGLIFESFEQDSPMKVSADLSPVACHALMVSIAGAVESSQFDTAENLFVILCEIDATNPMVWEQRADVAAKRACPHDALAYYEKALDIDPGRSSTIKKCISLRGSTGLNERVIQIAHEYLAIKPDDSYIWNDLGTIFGGLNRYEEAKNCFRMAVKHGGDDSLHWTNLGGVLLQTRETRQDVLDGLECLDRALGIDPDHLGAQFNRAAALLMLGDFKAAERAFLNILQDNPDFPQIADLLQICKQEQARLDKNGQA